LLEFAEDELDSDEVSVKSSLANAGKEKHPITVIKQSNIAISL
jgi:hypothetical protein